MKYLIMFLFLFASVAEANDMPKYLVDGVITVTLKNGKTYTYSANEYMVVKRGAKKVAVVPAPVPATESRDTREEPKKNRISLVVGYGLNGKIKTEMGPSQVDVEQEKGAVGGIVLQHDLNKEYHIMGGVLTNQTGFLGVGKDF